MKIGILNCQHIDNFGAVLVAYALQQTIGKLGYQAEVINYNPQIKTEKIVPNKTLKYYLNRIKDDGLVEILERKIQQRKNKSPVQLKYLDHNKYEMWRKKYIVYGSEEYHETSYIEGYNLLIEGSDVVWKPQRLLGAEGDMFLLRNVQNDTMRATYAASIGTNDIKSLASIKDVMEHYVSQYDAISVREESSKAFVEECTKKSVDVCIDPTMLLTREDYENLTHTADTSEYIFMYTMGINEEAIKFVNLMSEKLQCGVIHPNVYYVNQKIKNTIVTYEDADPSDFLSYVKHAKMVVTNSFHGTVFSLIFHTPFYTFGRGNINIRMQDLLQKFGIEDHFLESASRKDICNDTIDFDKTDFIMECERRKGIDYLKRIVNEANKC